MVWRCPLRFRADRGVESREDRFEGELFIDSHAGGSVETARDVVSRLSVARTASILQDLVRARSQNPVDGEGLVAQYVGDFLQRLGLEVTTQEVPGHRTR